MVNALLGDRHKVSVMFQLLSVSDRLIPYTASNSLLMPETSSGLLSLSVCPLSFE
ncbi:hypothetical protein [Anabaena azotica]|uniref:Uncharacterized protein n=1 Tax=Anabaena azotica FACHB-119 TaxID=947527 RepID=A0ABR8DEY1_9NOST|nr:hypothetical protein [Anabaena azotica]MBD2505659.1 hypothetical protein [Anabaena azotica FACHB-119]